MEQRKTRARAFAVLGLAGVVMAVALFSPVTAAITKKKVKKVATKVATQIANQVANQVANPLAGRLSVASSKPVATATTSTGTPLTTSITAPASGYLSIHAGGNWANYTATEDTWGCKIFVDGSEVETRVIHSGNAANEEEDCTIETALSVGAGAHTVEYRWFNSDGGITYTDLVLIAEYFPFNGVGARP